MVALVRHSRRKRGATDRPDLTPPRQSSTLHLVLDELNQFNSYVYVGGRSSASGDAYGLKPMLLPIGKTGAEALRKRIAKKGEAAALMKEYNAISTHFANKAPSFVVMQWMCKCPRVVYGIVQLVKDLKQRAQRLQGYGRTFALKKKRMKYKRSSLYPDLWTWTPKSKSKLFNFEVELSAAVPTNRLAHVIAKGTKLKGGKVATGCKIEVNPRLCDRTTTMSQAAAPGKGATGYRQIGAILLHESVHVLQNMGYEYESGRGWNIFTKPREIEAYGITGMFYDLTEIAPGYYAQANAAVGMTREAWSKKHAWGGGVDYGAGAAMDQYYGSHAAAVKALGGEKAFTLEHGNPKYWLNPETTTWPKGPSEMYVPRVRQPQPARKR